MTEATAQGLLSTGSWKTVRRITTLGYFLALGVVVAVAGVPTGRIEQMVIIVAGLGITCLGRGWRRFGLVLLDWLPFTMLLCVYDMSRGMALAAGMPVHVADVADLERRLFGGTLPTVWLQQHFYSPTTVHWYDALATLVYSSHFVVTPALAAALWLRDRVAWFGYVVRVFVLSLAGLVTYVLFPEAPPWIAARDHAIPAVERLSARGWIWLHLGPVQEMLADAQRTGANSLAAMPSLHTAFALLAVLYLGARMRSPWRWLLALYPAAMGLALVYLGEHYVVDVVVGVGYAVAVHLLVTRLEQRRWAARMLAEADPERILIGK